METHYVLVRLECRARRQNLTLCVPVKRGVPAQLRCTPSSGGGSSSGGFPLCSECEGLTKSPRLAEAVDERIRRGWSDHVAAGAVVLTC